MGRNGPADWLQRRAAYGSDWTGFDETSHTKVRNYSDAPEADVPPDGASGGYDSNRRL